MDYRVDIVDHIPALREKAKQFPHILELGCAYGNGSTSAFIEGLSDNPHEDKKIISVDVVPCLIDYSYVDYWTHVLGSSIEEGTLQKVKELMENKNFDFVFVDTIHTYDQVKAEMEMWISQCHSKTVWGFHDTFWGGNPTDVSRAIDDVIATHFIFKNYKREDHSKECNGLTFLYPNT